jgi:hypothetical protein
MPDKFWDRLRTVKDHELPSEQIPELFDQHVYWSLREVNEALGAADLVDTGGPGVPPPLSVFEIVRKLAVIGKVDNSQQFFISCREALEAVTV